MTIDLSLVQDSTQDLYGHSHTVLTSNGHSHTVPTQVLYGHSHAVLPRNRSHNGSKSKWEKIKKELYNLLYVFGKTNLKLNHWSIVSNSFLL